MAPPFAAFSMEEHRERLRRARDTLRAAGCEVCLSVAPEHHYYLAGYDSWVGVNSPQALIFTANRDDAPTLLLRDVDLPLALESSWLEDIRTYRLNHDDPAEIAAAIVAEKAAGAGDVAVETQSYALPHALGSALTTALAPRAIVDATALLGGLRLVKSPAEVAYLRRAATHAEAGLAAARRHARVGISEIALAGEIEAALRRSGSDYWAIPTELAGGPRAAGGHAAPRDRLLGAGDLVHMEFAGVAARYHAVAIHSLALGEPGPRARELYEIARQSLAAGIAAVRPGVPVAAVEEASLAPLRRAGLEDAAMMRFGYGLGIAYPPIWLETLQIARKGIGGSFEERLEAGMVFVLHACLELPDEGLGVVQGGTYLLGSDGLEMLVGGGDVPLECL